MSGTHSSLIRVPVKCSSTSSLLARRILDKILSVTLVPDNVRYLSLLSPANNIQEPSKKYLLKKSTAMTFFAAANKVES